eukprot:TRINITY_DN2699_c0_g1_i5.p1 TRINITY_DN2699_c0_g1~~TRINITY_DN2699_c0_g1_i5.p1  ORF type:complete len:421 (+),score=97.20 TRINITY_DN2699_c0_g1_i5:85-1347(+)
MCIRDRYDDGTERLPFLLQMKTNRHEEADKEISQRELDEGVSYVQMKRKVLADVVEALIGLIYEECGRNLNTAQSFLVLLRILKPFNYRYTPNFKSPLNQSFNQTFEFVYRKINYRFKWPNVLLQAFTHITFRERINQYIFERSGNRVLQDLNQVNDSTIMFMEEEDQMNFNDSEVNKIHINEISYGSLEYLGDALWDFFVVKYLHEDATKKGSKERTPEALASFKSALSNNYTLALIAFDLELDKFMLTGQNSIREDARRFRQHLSRTGNEADFSLDTLQPQSFERMRELPKDKIKVFGDIFESFLGALLVDLEFDVDAACRLLRPLAKERYLDRFMEMEIQKYDTLTQFKTITKNNNCTFQIKFVPPTKAEKIKNSSSIMKGVMSITFKDKKVIEIEELAYDRRDIMDKLYELSLIHI